MSETTLRKDEILAIWQRPANRIPTQGPQTIELTRHERDALCDAAERAETLQAQLTEVTRERNDALQANLTWRDRHEADVTARVDAERERDDANARMHAAEASLAPLRAVVEAAQAFMAKWPEVEKASFAAVQIATIHGFPYTGPNVGAELKALADTLDALTADPSAPTPTKE